MDEIDLTQYRLELEAGYYDEADSLVIECIRCLSEGVIGNSRIYKKPVFFNAGRPYGETIADWLNETKDIIKEHEAQNHDI